jgi:hypothetical protein
LCSLDSHSFYFYRRTCPAVNLRGPSPYPQASSPQWSSSYHVCHWTQGLWVQTQPRMIQICSMTSFGGEVKLVVPCCKILYGMLWGGSIQSVPLKRYLQAKFTDISRQVSPASLLGVSAGYHQRALVCEPGMIRTQMGKRNRVVMVTVYGTPCAIPPHKQQQ